MKGKVEEEEEESDLEDREEIYAIASDVTKHTSKEQKKYHKSLEKSFDVYKS